MALSYARRMNLAAMTPRGDLSSTGYALANPAASGAEYLVYAPNGGTFTVDLRGTNGAVNVEWFNPSTGTATTGAAVNGGTTRSFQAPFSGDAALYLSESTLPTTTATPTPTATYTPAATATGTPTPRRQLTPQLATATGTPTPTAI